MIAKEAKYENIVILHDYLKFDQGWYQGQLISGNNFKIRMDKIINYDGTRFRDWCLFWKNKTNFLENNIKHAVY